MEETHQLTDNMKIFFDKLLELKAYVKSEVPESKYQVGDVYTPIKEIYDRLDAIIQEKQ